MGGVIAGARGWRPPLDIIRRSVRSPPPFDILRLSRGAHRCSKRAPPAAAPPSDAASSRVGGCDLGRHERTSARCERHVRRRSTAPTARAGRLPEPLACQEVCHGEAAPPHGCHGGAELASIRQAPPPLGQVFHEVFERRRKKSPRRPVTSRTPPPLAGDAERGPDRQQSIPGRERERKATKWEGGDDDGRSQPYSTTALTLSQNNVASSPHSEKNG